jgi:hypothetical protein
MIKDFKFLRGHSNNIITNLNEQYNNRIMVNYYNRPIRPEFYGVVNIADLINFYENSDQILTIIRNDGSIVINNGSITL